VIGTRVNNYEIIQQIGEGGMGAVYLAHHPAIDRRAAIKVLRPELVRDTELVARFFNEARAANAIRHPNIIDILDVGFLPGTETPYLLMEFLEGENVAARLQKVGRMQPSEALDLGLQTASALAAAHSKGIVHRDLKPENLFLCPDLGTPGREVVKVLDFGIAKLKRDLSSNQVKTQTGALMGTPPYMSPEQCRGISGEIDHRTDIYALGIILYEALCGSPPFTGTGFGDILVLHLTKAPEPPRMRNPLVPPHFEAVVLRALAKKPEDRFAGMADLRAALAAGVSAAPSVVTAIPAHSPSRSQLVSRPTPEGEERRTSTTFSTAAGQVEELATVVPRTGRRVALVGAIAVVAGLGVVFALKQSGGAPAPAPAPEAAAAPPAHATPPVAPTPAPLPAALPAAHTEAARPADAGAPAGEAPGAAAAPKQKKLVRPKAAKPAGGPEKW
jgi:serine/threonine-protein kinase